jgi:hypothetical protein
MTKTIALLLSALLLFAGAGVTACSREFVGGAAVGAAGAGAAYEYSNKRQLDDLKEQYESGKIDRDEYLRRKKEIEDRSLVY